MSVFDSGIVLEREVLSSLLKDIDSCRSFVYRIRPSYFSSPARRFIFEQVVAEFGYSNALLPESVLESVIYSKHDDKKVQYVGEKNIIFNTPVASNVEAALRVLNENRIGRETLEVMDSVSGLLSDGKFLEAATEFRQKAFGLALIEDGKEVKGVFSDVQERIDRLRDKRDNPEKYAGLKTGIKTFDVRTGGLFPGEMTLIAAVTGVGKSTLVKQIEFGIITENPGKNVLHIANEEYEEQVNSKFDALLTNIDYLDFKFANHERFTDEVIRNWELTLAGIKKRCGGEIYTREVPAFSDVNVIKRIFHELKMKGIRIDAILIDHLPNMRPVQKAYNENNEKEKIAEEVKEMARELHVPVVIPTQAATQVEEKQMKGKRASKLDVYGSKAQIHHANTFFMITYLGRDDETKREDGEPETLEYLKDVFLLGDVKKNRDGPAFTFKLRHKVKTGRVEEIEVDPDVQKRIDKEHARSLKTGDYSSIVDIEETSRLTESKSVDVGYSNDEFDKEFEEPLPF